MDDEYPSLRIKLNEYVAQTPLGKITRLTLNNNKQDTSQLSQWMAYDFFNRVGVAAPRVGFASVFVNGQHLGVYSLVEAVDKAFLEERFGSAKGDLLEGTLADFSRPSLRRMEWKSGQHAEIENWRVNQLADLLNSEACDLESVARLVDLDQFYLFWATESLLACWDGYTGNQNNYFVYDDPKTERMRFIPWGADALWSSMGGPFGGFQRPIESVYANSLLPHRLLTSPDGQRRYRATLQGLLDKHWKEDDLKDQVDTLGKLVEPHLHARQKGSKVAQENLQRFIQFRRQRVSRELDQWPPEYPTKPRTPMHTVDAGLAKGEFSTYWIKAPKGTEGTGSMELFLDGSPIKFEQLRVQSRRFSMGFFGFGAPADSMPPIVEFVGKVDNATYTLTLAFEKADFSRTDSSPDLALANVSGSLIKTMPGEAPAGMWNPNTRWLKGTCHISEAAMVQGAPIRGSFEINLYRLVGGFFGG
jgi:hypothetical protein